MSIKIKNTNPFNIIVIVSALGYFVDIYDLILFGIVRTPSLMELGFSGDELKSVGVKLLNYQMTGMLVGGIFWGVLGDIRGRLSVLFGSICLYSLANIANGFVHDINTYSILRFIAGVGLAGELGAGVTLVTETMSKEHRGWGTMIIACFGALGAVLASLIGDAFDWRTAYFVGGGLGIALLIMRFGTYESGMFEEVKQTKAKKGSFFHLFTSFERFFKYLACISIGLPVWFTVGLLIIFAPDFANALNVSSPVSAGKAIMFCYIGLSVGDLLSGYISQVLKSRKIAIGIFLVLSGIFICCYFFISNLSYNAFIFICFALGFSTGYWALFVTLASEQFGTNIRATVTTTVPNFVRGAVVPITLSFQSLRVNYGDVDAALIVGFFCLMLALISIVYLKETFGKDLDYVEQIS
jgi:putative MFS transporter